MDDEWEEQEQLVVVELSGIISNDFLSKTQTTCKILDIDSDRPMMQVGQYVFAGEYEDALGTCVLFEEETTKVKADSQPELKYKCHTVKKLMMQRIFLTEKRVEETEESADNDPNCQPSQEENDNQQREPEEEMDIIDLEDSTVS